MDIPKGSSEFFIKLAADTKFTASAQQGHLKLTKYFLENRGDVHAQNRSGDTLFTYACENGDTDLANLLLEFGAELEHESKDGRTPLMKACHAGHLSTVQFLISKGADVNRQTTKNDHTPLSLACAGGHLPVVELLLAEGANRYHKLRNNSTMIIEAVKEGHTAVVQSLLDYCPSKMLSQQGAAATMLPGLVSSQDSSLPTRTLPPNMFQSANFFQPPANLDSSEFSSEFLQEDFEVVQIIPEEGTAQSQWTETINKQLTVPAPTCPTDSQQGLEDSDFLNEDPTVQQQHSYSPLSINAEGNEKPLEQDVQAYKAPFIEQECLVIQDETQNNLSAASTFLLSSNLPQLLTARARAFIHAPQQEPCLELYDQAQESTTKTLEQKGKDFVEKEELTPALIGDGPYLTTEGTAFMASLADCLVTWDESAEAYLHGLKDQVDDSTLENVVPTNGTQLAVLQVVDMFYKDQTGAIYQTGSQEEMNIVQQRLVQSACLDITTNATVQSTDHCQVSCSQHLPVHEQQTATHQVQAATQTPQPATVATKSTKQAKGITVQEGVEVKKDRLLLSNQTQTQYGPTFQQNLNLNYQIDPNSAITQYNGVDRALPSANYCLDLNSETKPNRYTALTIACAKGYVELVKFLIKRGANIEHRDKKGFTPLICASKAGHEKVVKILLQNGADIEAQTYSTKYTALGLAILEKKYKVVKLLLNRGANKEHRNKNDHTPLMLAALCCDINIVTLLLKHAVEINSHSTESETGITALMLAAVRGNIPIVKLLLNMGSDIHAQLKANNNTTLTLACCQGKYKAIVSLLLDRKANIEHRTKAGRTPLMEAAHGGFVEIGRILLWKGANINAAQCSSGHTALTLASGHGRWQFVEFLLKNGATVEAKTKLGQSPLWLAAYRGYLTVVKVLKKWSADFDSKDNRNVSCLMGAFQNGHVEVVLWMINYVTQFPSDKEMSTYFSTINDEKLLKKCRDCEEIIKAAKETQAAKANKNASILLEELDMEKKKQTSKKLAAARRREQKKKKKLEKREENSRLIDENRENEKYHEDDDKKNMDEDTDKLDDKENRQERSNLQLTFHNGEVVDKEEDDSGTTASSQSSYSSNDVKKKEQQKEKSKKKLSQTSSSNTKKSKVDFRDLPIKVGNGVATSSKTHFSQEKSYDTAKSLRPNHFTEKSLMFEDTPQLAKQNDFEAIGNESYVPAKNKKSDLHNSESSPKQSSKREEFGKEIIQTVTTNDLRVKKASIPLNEISHVIDRRGNNINAIGGAKAAHIEVEKQSKSQEEKIIPITGTVDTTKETHLLAKVPDDILQMLPKRNKSAAATSTLWDKPQLGTKKISVKVVKGVSQSVATTTTAQQKALTTTMPFAPSTTSPSRSTAVTKQRGSIIATLPQITAPRLVAQDQNNAVAQLASNMKSTMSYTTAIMTTTTATTKVVTTTATQTFAAKLTENTSSNQTPVSVYKTYHYDNTSVTQSLNVPQVNTGPLLPQVTHTQTINNQTSPKLHHSTSTASVQPNVTKHYQAPGKFPLFTNSSTQPSICTGGEHSISANLRQSHSFIPQVQLALTPVATPHVDTLRTTQISNNLTKQDYSVFNSMVQQTTQRQESESHKPINFAALTREGTSKTTTPPSLLLTSGSNCQSFPEEPKNQSIHLSSQTNQHDMSMSSNHNCSSTEIPSQSVQHLAHSDTNLYKSQSADFQESAATNMLGMLANDVQQCLLPLYHLTSSIQQCNYSQPQQQQPTQISTESITTSHLNPKASDFFVDPMPNKQPLQIYSGYLMGNENSSTHHAMNRSVMGNYHRSAMETLQSSQPLWQLPQPFSEEQSELLSEMAGMTLNSIARTVGADILENGEEYSTGNSSAAMSPNDRCLLQRYQIDDYISQPLDSFQYGVPLENPHNYASGALFQENLLQQQQMNNVSPLNFIPDEFWTMELPQFGLSKYD